MSKLNNDQIFNKRDLKRIAKKLDFEEAKVYKWCWERKKKDVALQESLAKAAKKKNSKSKGVKNRKPK
jgi:hypothetical protein